MTAQPPLKPPNWAAVDGAPTPLGLRYIAEESAYNFALYSKYATAVTLLLYGENDAVNPVDSYQFRFPENRSGRVWHCRLPAARVEKAVYYAYSVDGPFDPAQGQRFDKDKILLDPYARAVHFPACDNRLAALAPGSNAGKAPLGVISAATVPFDWTGDVSPRHGHDTVIYEMHVKGFTARDNSGVAAGRRGAYAGVIDKIPHLLELGVTVVELLPVYQFDPQENDYWGYMPLNFFSPHRSYASDPTPGGQYNEFRAMVKALHQAGIEVVLDVVYNHTTEADERGPNYCFRGIDNTTYYLLDWSNPAVYRNDAGTGNVLHCANAAVRKMILDSMRFWVMEMHVDGFRFDLASIFTRNDNGSVNLDDPAVVSDISGDPIFENVRLIAEAWDLGTYQLGRNFPGMTWLQWNGKFRDQVRQFVKSDEGMVGALMTRLYGSDDLFPQDVQLGYRPYQSVNYICSHDGFNLKDLVTYQQKRNLANGNNNTDGPDDNYSWNCGWEGDADVPADVAELRKRQIRNFLAILLLSNGTPMLRMGDEFMDTQQGNNNPYNQDNEITWLDWSLRAQNADMFRFCQQMIAFRKSHPSIARNTYWRDDVTWYGVSGGPDISGHAIAYRLRGASAGDQDLYVMINSYWEPLDFTIEDGLWSDWRRVVDTTLASPMDIGSPAALEGPAYSVGPRSVVVLVRG
jgi:glycogen operon protein